MLRTKGDAPRGFSRRNRPICVQSQSPNGATTFAADKRHSDERTRTRRGVHCQKGSDTFDKARSTFSPGTPAADCFDATLRANFSGLVSARARLYILFNRPRPKLLLNIRITPPQRGDIFGNKHAMLICSSRISRKAKFCSDSYLSSSRGKKVGI
jgi:hypothetical protein